MWDVSKGSAEATLDSHGLNLLKPNFIVTKIEILRQEVQC